MTAHPLTTNRWAVEGEPEHGSVPLSYVHHIDRARCAIETMARIVGNNADEPDATGSLPLDSWTVTSLMGGIESLCSHMRSLTEEMLIRAHATRADEISQAGGAK